MNFYANVIMVGNDFLVRGYENGKRVQNGMHELDRKAIVSSFFHSWIHEELKERNMNFMFGPYHKKGCGREVLVTFRESIEDFIEIVDNFRSEETNVLPHFVYMI